MLLYVESKAFPVNTFVLNCQEKDTMARVRAQIMHILYEFGRADHQFRLRYKGQYLRDAYTLDDYEIPDHALLKMIPMSKKQESFVNLQSSKNKDVDLGMGQSVEVTTALEEEIRLLLWRQNTLLNLQGFMYALFLFVIPFSLFTTYWYSVSWSLVIWLFGVLYLPMYSHAGGFTGRSAFWYKEYMIIEIVGLTLNLCASLALALYLIYNISIHGCDSFEGACSLQAVYSFVYYAIHFGVLLIALLVAVMLHINFKFDIGNKLESQLIVTRDVNKVIQAAKTGRLKEQRNAAFELATLATTGDDGKFRIVAEGGLEVLISLGLAQDEATQEYATEAIAELLTIPAILDQFVEMGGVGTLSTLLHSNSGRLVHEAATALSYIVSSESEENRAAVVADRGLEDLAHAARYGAVNTRRSVAGIFLELAFNPDIRSMMAGMNTPAVALVVLCKSSDEETKQLAFQTLELLAIENPDVITYQEDLLEVLLQVPLTTLDSEIYLLAGKILMYYAQNSQSCKKMLECEIVKESLLQFARTNDPILQRVVAKIMLHCREERDLADCSRDLGLEEVVTYVKENALSREIWNMTDEWLSLYESDELYQPGIMLSDNIMGAGSLMSLTKPVAGAATTASAVTGSVGSLRASRTSLKSRE